MSEEKKKVWDPVATLERSRQFYRDSYMNSAPKLTLIEQCQVYACLYRGVKPAIVRLGFELSHSTVTYIGGCRDDERKPETIEFNGYSETIGGPTLAYKRMPQRKQRYADVAKEFERLGEDEFMRTYYTEDVGKRIENARLEFNSNKKSRRFYFRD